MAGKRDLAEAIWRTIITASGQAGRTRVNLPVVEVVDVLLSLVANVVSQIPDAAERDRIIRDMSPKVGKVVDAARKKTDVYLAAKPSSLILPN